MRESKGLENSMETSNRLAYLAESMVKLRDNVVAISPQLKTPAALCNQPLVLPLQGSDSYA